MKIEYENKKNIFYVISRYDEKDIIKECKFRWNLTLKRWETTDTKNVENLIKLLDPQKDIITENVKNALKEKKEEKKAILEKSMSAVADIDIPAPTGLNYMPFQKAGIDFISHQKNVLVADEMGLGKTIQAIGYINLNSNIKTVLIICPASLKINWKQELEKWLTRPASIEVLNENKLTDIVITNYESVKKYFSLLTSRMWDLLILDESHYIKNYKAQRTKYITGYFNSLEDKKSWVRGLKDYTNQKILLTGTPIMNKPVELITQLKVLNNELAKNPFKFMERYVEKDAWGGAIGSKNLEELQYKLRTSCMIRREKKDVLTELPDKLRQIITLPKEILKNDNNKTKEIISYLAENWDVASGKLTGAKIPFDEIAKTRHEQSVKKIQYIIEHIENVLEDEDKIVVFAHHHDVINAIYEKFKNIAVIATGEQSLKERNEAVDKFQNEPNIKLFIGSTEAMGVGITLTASQTVIFAELEWRPGDLFQAEDRLHRIGQKNTVLVQYLVIDESIDSFMIHKILEKTEIIDEVTNKEKVNKPDEKMDSLLEEFKETNDIENSKPEELKIYIEDKKAQPVLEALQILANNDNDYARENNGVGFNGRDTTFGHILANLTKLTEKQYVIARKILIKYHRQIPVELYNVIYENNIRSE